MADTPNPDRAITKAELIETTELVSLDITRLARAILTLNRLSVRSGQVDELVNPILTPTKELSDAHESLAKMKSTWAMIGPELVSLVVEWDNNMRFVTLLRGKKGFHAESGFSLVQGTHGFRAMQQLLVFLGVSDEKALKLLVQPVPVPEAGIMRRSLLEPAS